MTRRPTRRRAPIAAATALVALAALSACSGDTDPGAQDGEDDTLADCQPAKPLGSFSYTDGRGKLVELDEIPTTVVAQSSVAAGLWDAGYQVDGVYGEVPDEPLPNDRQLGSVDTSGMKVIGKTYGEFDTEAYGQMQPDLLLDYTFDGENLWYVPAKQSKQILGLASSVAIPGTPKTIDEAIGTFIDLAGRLGVDTKCDEEIVEAKEDYQEALAEIGEVAKAKPLKVIIASVTADSFYVVNPSRLPETRTLADAGLTMVEPSKDPGVGEVFEQLSWEKAADFKDVDVILLDGRTTPELAKTIEGIDTWANLPAVKSGQVYTWYAGAPYSYQGYAEIFDELADQLEKSDQLP